MLLRIFFRWSINDFEKKLKIAIDCTSHKMEAKEQLRYYLKNQLRDNTPSVSISHQENPTTSINISYLALSNPGRKGYFKAKSPHLLLQTYFMAPWFRTMRWGPSSKLTKKKTHDSKQVLYVSIRV